MFPKLFCLHLLALLSHLWADDFGCGWIKIQLPSQLTGVSKSLATTLLVLICSDIGNFSSDLILLALVMSILPKYVVHRSEFSSNVVVLTPLT